MITTEEYKDLILAKNSVDRLNEELMYADKKLENAQNSIKELLLMLTEGKTAPTYNDEFNTFEIASDTVIAKYINENYLSNRMLNFNKTKENKK